MSLPDPHVLPFPTFDDIWRRAPGKEFRGTLTAFDPGETTGAVIFTANQHGVRMHISSQLITWPITFTVSAFQTYLDQVPKPTVVFESYRVYNWKTDSHANSEVPTLQVIGCLKTICIQRSISYYQQSAQIAKQFITDEKLEAWGFYKRGEKHARDAMRHALYFLLFGPKKDS